MIFFVTTRFTDDTWRENYNYRLKLSENDQNNANECIYGSPQEMSPKIFGNSIVFVIEMNNTQNKIIGIGLIKNKPLLNKYYKIYNDCNYNRYVYKSRYHIDREKLIQYNENLVKSLDHILFKEKTHLKRGCGFTTIPEKLIKHPICNNLNIKKEIQNIFIRVFNN